MQGGFAARSKGGHDALEAGGAQVAGDEDAWVLGGGKAVASCIACIADDVAGRGSRCVADAEEDGIGRSGPPFARVTVTVTVTWSSSALSWLARRQSSRRHSLVLFSSVAMEPTSSGPLV